MRSISFVMLMALCAASALADGNFEGKKQGNLGFTDDENTGDRGYYHHHHGHHHHHHHGHHHHGHHWYRDEKTLVTPVLETTNEEHEILRAAVEEVVEKDPLVPDHKKEEATDFAVKQMKEGFKKSNMTLDRLVDIVEAEAAKRNATEVPPHEAKPASTDRSYWGSYGYPSYGSYGGYYPSYYPGYGYGNCLYSSYYGYCQQQLYGAYAYYGGYHHHYRRPHWYRDDGEDDGSEGYKSDEQKSLLKKKGPKH